MIDVLLINPPLSQEERYGIKFKAGGQTPPTGLAILAAILRAKGWKPAILDAPALGLDTLTVASRAKDMAPSIIGVTAVTASIFNAQSVAAQLKTMLPQTPILLGGPHVTAVPDETMRRFPCFDIGVLAEGDVTILDLAECLIRKKGTLSDVQGIIYRSGDSLHTTPPRPFMETLDQLPFPAWDLLPDLATHYCPPAHTLRRSPAMLMVPTRGCPGKCIFCDRKVFGRHMRSHSADYIFRMLLHLKERYGIREIQFRDDNLLAYRKVLRELCTRMIDSGIDLTWSCAGRVDMVNEEILHLMKRAGCWQIWYGVESGSDRVLQVIQKNTSVEKIRRAITLTHEAGISPCGFFMIGNPTETEEDIHKTIDILLELPFADFHMCHFTPLPGSEIYDNASEYGTFENDWKKLTCWTTAFTPSTVPADKLVAYANQAFRRFYFRPRIVWAYMKRLRSFRNVKVFFTAFLGFLQYTFQKNR